VCRPIGEAGGPLEARRARLAANYSGMVFGVGFDLSVLSAVFSSAAPASSVFQGWASFELGHQAIERQWGHR